MRVLDLQRIEGPFHAADAARKRLTSLLQLELRPEPAIAIVVAHGQHVRVQVGLWISVCGILPRFDSRQRHGETDHRLRCSIRRGTGQIGIESSNHLAADFLPDEKRFAGDDVAIVVTPRFNLHLDAGFEFIVAGARADQDHGRGSLEGVAAAEASLRFASAQRASSSAGCNSSSGFSDASSICLNRWRKRRLQPRRAISASTPRWRPRLTTVKSRSPSSASTPVLSEGSEDFSAAAASVTSSAVSSVNLGSRSRQWGQSKPDFAAFAPILPASAKAGMATCTVSNSESGWVP